MRWLAGWTLLLLTACWSGPVAIQTEPLPSDRPTAPASQPSSGPQRPESMRLSGRLPEFSPYTPPALVVRDLANGLLGIALRRPDRSQPPVAALRLVLPAGRATGAPGLADLAAAALCAGSSADAPSLEHEIATLGGQLTIATHAAATVVELVLPAAQWDSGLRRLAEALRQPPESGVAFERTREVALERLRTLWTTRPDTAQLERIATDPKRTPDAWLSELQDRSATELAAYWRQITAPRGAVLALAIPELQPESVLTEAAAAVAVWTTAAGNAPSVAQPPAALPPGMHWAPRAGLARLHFVVERPLAAAGLALETLVLQEILLGADGRFAQALRQAGPELEPHRLAYDEGRRRFDLVGFEMAPEFVPVVRALLAEALASFASRPLSADELEIGTARARLTLLADLGSTRTCLAACTSSVLAGAMPLCAAAETYAQLGRMEPQRVQAALPALAASVSALLVVGGSAAGQEGALVLEDPWPRDAFTERSENRDAAAIRAATAYLDLAVSACGGKATLAAITGFSARTIRRTASGPEAIDRIWFAADGRLRRVRQVLATEIETVVAGGAARERSGTEILELENDEARTLVQAVERHPLLLLAAHAQGRLSMRLLAVRTVDEREMAVLERVDPSRERLRLFLDAQSGLVRRIETREWRPGIGRVPLVENFADYRSAAGVRVPFHVESALDPGGEPVATEWLRFVPTTPTAEELTPGGPRGDDAGR